MTTARAALKRDRARHAADRAKEGLAGPDTYRAREPYRKIRAGEQVQARAGELFVVVADVDGAEQVLGHVRAAQAGLLELAPTAAAAS